MQALDANKCIVKARSTAMRLLCTTEAQALSITHARVQVYCTRAITSVVYGSNAENEPVSRIKMADYMGTL